MGLTEKQLDILRCIHRSIEEHGYPPTVREICTVVGFASTSTVHGYLGRLEKAGYLIRDASKTRAIELSRQALDEIGVQPTEIPLLGRVAAGSPILAVEEASDYFPIPPGIKYEASELFMLEIAGDSMINIGIFDGDYITVRRQSTANNGDVVIAMTEESEATCKTYYRQADHIILRPENDHMDDIILPNVTILGKVISLFRYV